MITLKTLPNATAQQVFDQVADHLLTQNKKSMDDRNRCVYHGPDGMRCAAGCLIADGEYDPEFEGRTWVFLPDFSPLVPCAHQALISSLQIVHDDSEPEAWPVRLRALAGRFGLNADKVIP